MNHPRKYIQAIIVFLLGAAASGATAALLWPSDNAEHSHDSSDKTLYTCGMHPQVVREEPGNCPICGMALVPMNAKKNGSVSLGPCRPERALYWRAPMDPSFISDKPGKSPMGMALVPVCEAQGPGQVSVEPRIVQSMGVRTALVKKGTLHRTVRTVARLEVNERKVVVVTTKIAGWIEKLYVNETGQFVRRGQPLFSIYSPQAVAGQQEYLLAKRQGNDLLVRSARDRLLFWDFTKRQIERLEARGQPSKTLKIFSPATGFVVHKSAIEGGKVKPEKTLFKIVDLSTVWVQADVYEYEVPWLRVGQPAELSLSYVPGRTFKGKVSYIYPYLDESSRTVRVRLEFPNPDLLMKPGMFGTVRIQTQAKEAVTLIPSQAVLRTGRRNIAFLSLGEGHFKAVELTLGDEGDDDLIAVLSGLTKGQRIVVSGHFLLDSESQLNEALQKIVAPAKSTPGPASSPASVPASRSGVQ